jgi:hypothetical protein
MFAHAVTLGGMTKITDEQIRSLRLEASAANDDEMWLLCELALSEGPLDIDDYSGGGHDAAALRRVVKLTPAQARAKCAEALEQGA